MLVGRTLGELIEERRDRASAMVVAVAVAAAAVVGGAAVASTAGVAVVGGGAVAGVAAVVADLESLGRWCCGHSCIAPAWGSEGSFRGAGAVIGWNGGEVHLRR